MIVALYRALDVGSELVFQYSEEADRWRSGGYVRLSEPLEINFTLLPAALVNQTVMKFKQNRLDKLRREIDKMEAGNV